MRIREAISAIRAEYRKAKRYDYAKVVRKGGCIQTGRVKGMEEKEGRGGKGVGE